MSSARGHGGHGGRVCRWLTTGRDVTRAHNRHIQTLQTPAQRSTQKKIRLHQTHQAAMLACSRLDGTTAAVNSLSSGPGKATRKSCMLDSSGMCTSKSLIILQWRPKFRRTADVGARKSQPRGRSSGWKKYACIPTCEANLGRHQKSTEQRSDAAATARGPGRELDHAREESFLCGQDERRRRVCTERVTCSLSGATFCVHGVCLFFRDWGRVSWVF